MRRGCTIEALSCVTELCDKRPPPQVTLGALLALHTSTYLLIVTFRRRTGCKFAIDVLPRVLNRELGKDSVICVQTAKLRVYNN